MEDWTSPSEKTIGGGINATGGGFWARIDEKDYIISTLTDSVSGDVDIVLYDIEDPALTPENLTGGESGEHRAAWINWDGAAGEAGRYTLVGVQTDAEENTFIEVYQRIANVWTFQYKFDAESAMGDDDFASYHVQSPELFTYMDHLYIAFVVADEPDSLNAELGNILITRVEADDDDPEDNHYRQLNEADGALPTKKRIEPEVHYMFNNQPVVFYSQRSEPPNDPDNCSGLVLKLMRAKTGWLWQD